MTAELRLAIRGNLRRVMEADARAGERAVTSVVRSKTKQTQRGLRRQVVRAGLGQRLANAVRSDAFPKRGSSMEAKGIVFSKAFVGGSRREPIDLISVFSEGTRIRSRRQSFLAIPTDQAGRGRGRRTRPQPSDFPPGILAPIFHGAPRLVFRNDPRIVAFWLVREVRIRPRLSPTRALERATANFDQQVAKRWERFSQRAFQRIR